MQNQETPEKLCPRCGSPMTNYIDYGPGLEIDNWECDLCEDNPTELPDEDVADNGQWLIDKMNVSMDMAAGPAYTVADFWQLSEAFPARPMPIFADPLHFTSELDKIAGEVKFINVLFKP